MNGLHGVRRNRVVDGAIEPDEGCRRAAAGGRLRNDVRGERYRVIAKLALTGKEPEVLTVIGRVGEIVFVLFAAQAEIDIELVGRSPQILERKRRKIWRDVVEKARVTRIGDL